MSLRVLENSKRCPPRSTEQGVCLSWLRLRAAWGLPAENAGGISASHRHAASQPAWRHHPAEWRSVYPPQSTGLPAYFMKNILHFLLHELIEWMISYKKMFTVVIETLLMLQSQTVRANALCKHFLWTSLLCEYVCLSVRLSVTSLTLGLLDLQIYAVTPVSDISDVPQLERVPERIKSFYRINNVSRFHYDRPFHKGPKDRENEFRVRWASSATLSHLNETLVIKHDMIGFMEWTVLDTVQQTFCMIYLKPSPFDLYSPRYPFSLSSTFGKENSLQKKI